MTLTIPASASRRLQIWDDQARDPPRLDPGAPQSESPSTDVWIDRFMTRLAASVQSLARKS